MALSILVVFAQVSKPLGGASGKKSVKSKGTYGKMRCSIMGDIASKKTHSSMREVRAIVQKLLI